MSAVCMTPGTPEGQYYICVYSKNITFVDINAGFFFSIVNSVLSFIFLVLNLRGKKLNKWCFVTIFGGKETVMKPKVAPQPTEI